MCGAPLRKLRGMAALRIMPVEVHKEVSLPPLLEGTLLPSGGGFGHTCTHARTHP